MANHVRQRPINVDVSSDGSFDMAMGWVRTCLQTHSRCLSDSEKALPTRVIDVGICNTSKSPFLLISQGGRGRWVTLSCCWGNVTPPMTTSENLAKQCTQISLGSLPPLYQDAIDITRRFGYRYLWIDSLCILQDSSADWLAESSKMGAVYRNAVLNISADASPNPDCGIFESANRNRNIKAPLLNLPCRSSMEQLEGSIAIHGEPEWSEDESPLQKRAWVLQENMLSPRKLHYRSDELHFSCDTARIAHESDPDLQRVIPGEWTTHSGLHSIFRIPFVTDEAGLKFGGGKPKTDVSEIMDFWYRKIYDYAARQITFKTDRFPAIAGLAKEVAARTGYQYKAGLWLEDIHNGLLWQAPRVGVCGGHAPTWSWAVVDRQHHTLRQSVGDELENRSGLIDGGWVREDRYRAHIMQVQVKNVGNDSFGQVESARITIEGRWRSAHWDGKPTAKFDSWDNRFFVLHRHLRDSSMPENMPTVPCQIVCSLDESAPANALPPNFRQRRAIYLQVGRFQFEAVYGEAGLRYALILEPTGSASDEYRRIGVAQIPEDEGMADGWETRTITIV
jgi:Heterokaryon incompatibility protein (HET)